MLNLDGIRKDNDDIYVEAMTDEAGIKTLEKNLCEKIKIEVEQDPESRGYKGKGPKEIAELMNESFKVYTGKNVVVRKAYLQQAIDAFIQEYPVRPDDLFVDADGVIKGDYPEMQAVMDKKIAEQYQAYLLAGGTAPTLEQAMPELRTAGMEKVYEEKSPRWVTISEGVPYTANVVTAEDITAALA